MDAHVTHFPILQARPAAPDRGLRWTVVALLLVVVGLWTTSFFLPWWRFTLFAPQYPHGLRLGISLTGLSGDVHEIDMLNHYIGMGHLEDAARFERHMAGYAIGTLGVSLIALGLFLGRKLNWLLVVPGLVLPVGFVVDSWYWLRRYGHHLSHHAPLRIKPFTPQLFGEGVIGQFRTEALPAEGFWIAVAALAVLAIAVVVRRRVCGGCAARGDCSLHCPNHLIGK